MSKKNPGDHISPERMERFTWQEGDLKFFKTEEDFMNYAKENNLKVIKYPNFEGGKKSCMGQFWATLSARLTNLTKMLTE